jgi:hypothetical protein
VCKGEQGKERNPQPESEPSKTSPENASKLAWTKKKRLFKEKARQLDEEALIEIERHWSIQDRSLMSLNDFR